ncbi:hypothetical protein [EBPR podovirus 1]|jgi:hypothetical protein|nr:hypothetical protein [EBPR podovirus 1]
MSAATNQEGALEALNRALSTLDDGDMRAAAYWASIAADTIEACELTPDELRELAAPRDDTHLGEKVFFVSVILVLLLAVGDVLRGFLQ